jgi:hypothetical protein
MERLASSPVFRMRRMASQLKSVWTPCWWFQNSKPELEGRAGTSTTDTLLATEGADCSIHSSDFSGYQCLSV